MTPLPFTFEAPGWLLGLLLAPLLFGRFHRHAARPAARGAERALPILRTAALAALSLALAGAAWRSLAPGVDLHVVVDRSLSIDARGREEADRVVEQLMSALGPSDRIAVYPFASEALVARGLAPSPHGWEPPAEPDGRATHIQGAIEVALDRLDPNRSARILLLSDGLETAGDAEAVLERARAAGVPIDTYLLSRDPGSSEFALDQLLLPAAVAPGQPYPVGAVVSATADGRIEASLYRNGIHVATREIQVKPGRNLVSFGQLEEEVGASTGALRYEVRIASEDDTLAQNNVGYGYVRLEGPARVLLVRGDAEMSEGLIRALEAEALHVTEVDPLAAPLDIAALVSYDVVILANVPANAFSRRQLESLARYVEDAGGGLFVTGGEHSFGLGGYLGTPLEAILPVSMDTPQNLLVPSLAMILALDRSGSMAETQAGFAKLDLAKESALGVLDLVEASDLLGVIAFDSASEWIVPVQPVANRIAFASSIASLAPQGGTHLEPAMEEALAAFSRVEAAVKHLIILSDGRSSPGAFESLTRALRALGVTVSTVAIGRDADQELLERISLWGEGRYYFTEEIRDVPQIFAVETLVVSRPILINEPFIPCWDQAADFWSEATELPPLGGYVITTPKATAAVHLRAPDESPLLATWRRGLGRTAAFTSSLTGTWSAAWQEWEGFSTLIGQLVRWLMQPASGDGLKAQLLLEEGRGELTVDALDPEGAYRNFLRLEAEVLGPGGDALHLVLEQEGPGRYRASFPASREGAYTAVVREAAGGESSERAIAGAVLPYPEEFRLALPDRGLLRRLADETGGLVLERLDDEAIRALFRHPSPARHPRSLVPFLLAASLLLFSLDIGIRYLPRAELGVVLHSLAADGARRFRSLIQSGNALQREVERRIEEREARIAAERRARERATAESPVFHHFKEPVAERFLAERRKGREEKEGGRSEE